MAGSGNALGTAYVQIVPKLDGSFGKEVAAATGEAGTSSADSFGSSFGSGAKSMLATVGSAVAALGIGKAVSDAGKAAFDAYADYEQLTGGIETLYGEAYDTVMANASKAYQTVGMSANDYMETATSYAATLRQSLGGDVTRAAEQSDKALRQMADNANKMGTPLESITDAYNGFAKQNYTMLDNLKLGYGGTKEEMERLLADAQELSGQEYSIDSFSDIIDAIQVVQDELGITGTTAQEAASTISGSIASAGAAWDNWLAGLANGDADLGQLTQSLLDSVWTVGENAIPAIEQMFSGVGEAIGGAVSGAMASVGMDTSAFSAISEGISGFVGAVESSGVVGTMQGVLGEMGDAVVAFWNEDLSPMVSWAGENLPALGEAFSQAAETVMPVVGSVAGYMGDVLGGVVGALQNLWQTALPGVQSAIDLIVPAIQPFLAALQSVYDTVGPVVADVLPALGTVLGTVLTPVLTALGGIASTALSVVTGGLNLFVSAFQAAPGVLSAAASTVSAVFNGIKTRVSAVFDGIRTKVSTVVQSVSSVMSFQGLSAKVSGVFSSIKSAIAEKIDGAKQKVKSAIDTIKGAFNFSWSLPKLKVPKVKVSGGKAPWGIGGKGSLPSFSVEWAASGGIVAPNDPTIVGLGDNRRYDEVMAPLSPKVFSSIGEGVAQHMPATSAGIDYDRLARALAQQMQGLTVEVDGRAFGRVVRERCYA